MTALEDTRVVVIGAGLGGLAAAAYLSEAGARVTIVEKADAVGGKAARRVRDGFVFDNGPTVLTMPWIAEATFRAAGVELAKVAPLTRLDPACRYVFSSGQELALSSDLEASRAAIARIAPEDAGQWQGFVDECKGLWEIAGQPYLEAPFDGFFGLGKRMLSRGRGVMKMSLARGTLGDFARRHFRSREMRAFVEHFATYAGASPERASAAMGMIAYVEVVLGAFYPMGGMHALAAALARALESRGVRILTGARVASIDVDDGSTVRGVFVESAANEERAENPRGYERLAADAVVANVDPLVVLTKLLPVARRRAAGAHEIALRTPSLSGFAWAFGCEGPLPVPTLHSVYFSQDVMGEVRSVFEGRSVGANPTIGVSIPTLLDPGRAPDRHHAVFAQVYAPATARTTDWTQEGPRVRDAICARLEREWNVRLAPLIRSQIMVTPCDHAATGSSDGAIYGAALHGPTANFARPPNRARGVKGLYFAGGATHPGGGVTLVMQSGRFASDLIARDLRSGHLARSASIMVGPRETSPRASSIG